MVRNLVVVLLLFGFIVGLVPMGWYLIGEMTTDPSDVVYYGSYEPLYGATMSDQAMDKLNRQFPCRSQGVSSTWLYVVPIATAALGALAGIVLGKFGFVLARRRTREA